MPSLYEINQDLQLLVSNANPETGEINMEALNALTIAQDEKRQGVANYILHFDDNIAAIDKQVARLKALKDSVKSQKENLKKYLKTNLELDGIKTLDLGTLKIGVKTNPPKVIITDEAAVAEVYTKEKIVSSIDKTKIKKDIQDGLPVKGAHLTQETSLSIK